MHLVCVIIMYTMYKMYEDVALSRSSYTISLKYRGAFVAGDVKTSAGGGSVTTS